ncbi:chondroitin proteoglycan 1-like [Penaeus vannamei]|uniref:chondroitin proteoglycan 1-like n=1 Tax=Penaeus vannamei TaxID=6689 RepID=UPI00387FA840
MTNAWPFLKRVYQTEYNKEAVDYVATVMETMTVYHSFSLLATIEGLEPDLPVKACQDQFSSVSLTSTRLQVSTVVSTVTLLDVIPTYVSVTTTDCEPYAITHMETVSQYQAPQLAYSTRYVTELKIKPKNRIYTYTSYPAETISITYSATDVQEHLAQVVGTTTATTLSTASVVETVTASITTTATYTQVDVSSSITYIPLYVTTTMTNAWPILKTVYQTEYIKEAVDYVTTVMETSTVYHCHDAYSS